MPNSTAAFNANQKLLRTINVPLHLGNQNEDQWTVRLNQTHLDAIAQAGFTAIRLAVHWAAHTDPGSAHRIDPDVLERVGGVVQSASSHGLAVIVDNHLDRELMSDPPAYKERFQAISRQVAEYFKNAPESVMLEILAEPHARLDPLWNRYFGEALKVVRQIDPTRIVIVGPASFNNARKLSELQLPDADRNLIVTIHHYWPIKFTMQGETWLQLPWFMNLFLGHPSTWRNVTWEATPAQRNGLNRNFDAVAAWGRQHNRPVFLGEFGTTHHADLASRARWTQYIRVRTAITAL